MKTFSTFFIFLACIVKCYAQDPDSNPDLSGKKKAPWFVERFRLTAGVFFPVNNTNIQVGVKGGAAGTDIDFEKDLGFNKYQVTFLANFQWRISRRSRINLNYYNIPRSASHTLTRDITFKDTTYHVNASVNSFFNTAIYQFSYGYAIIEKPRYEVGVLIGTHTVGGKAGIALNGTNGGASAETDFGFTAPLPDLGIWGGYSISDRFAVTLDADYLSLTVDNISGRLLAYNLLLLYKLIPKLDLSLGFTGLNFRVDASKKEVEGQFKWGYNGLSIGATYSFGKKSWGH
jgi:hypothetical protein